MTRKRGERTGILHGRRAQITVFMIVGIILLFSSALIFYIRAQVTETISAEFVPEVEEVPLEVQPVKLYVENCIERVAREALELAGMHGGYIEPENESLSGKAFIQTLEPTESDGVDLNIPGTFVPYWWYLESANNCRGNCQFQTQRPFLHKDESLYAIESQIDLYVNRELELCIDDFSIFRGQGFDFNILGEVETNTRIGDRDISVYVEYPVEVVQDGKVTEVNKFFTRVDLNFKRIYDMASEIINEQVNMSYLESHLMNLITMYSKPLSEDKLPPPYETTIFAYEFLYWTVTETRDKIENYVLPPGIGMMQVFMARNYERVLMFKRNWDGDVVLDKIGSSLMDQTALQLPNNYTQVSATFTYLPWWPVYLNINDEEVLMARKAESSLLSFIAFNSYVFYYDLSFPVLVTLEDPDAFDGEGYTFMFALEGNLRNNEPVPQAENRSVFTVTEGTMVCQRAQQHSGPVQIEVVDAISGEPVEGAKVSMVFDTEGCHVGLTELNEENKSVVVANLPIGLGQVRIAHDDYLDFSTQAFVADEDESFNVTVELMPYRYVNVSASTRPLTYDKSAGKYVLPKTVPFSPLDPDEKAMFIFTRMDNDSFYNYKTQALVEGPTDTGLVKLVPGTYKVDGTIILDASDQPIIVPKETHTFGGEGLFGLFGDPVPITVNATEFENWQTGGVKFNNETGYLVIDRDTLFSNEKLLMWLLRFPLPVTHSRSLSNAASLDQIGEVEKYTSEYRTALTPQWLG